MPVRAKHSGQKYALERSDDTKEEWLGLLREEKGYNHQDDLKNTAKMTTSQWRKLPKWKVPGPDQVQGYWLKSLTSLQIRIAQQTDEMINNKEKHPAWMTKGGQFCVKMIQIRGIK